MKSDNLFIEGYSFLKHLTKDELYKLLVDYKNGNESAKEKIILYNLRLVLFRINQRFCSLQYDKSELLSIGILGLVKAVNTVSLDKSFEFSAYAIKCIDNEILMFLRKSKKDRKVVSFNHVLKKLKDDTFLTVEDVLVDDSDIFEIYSQNELNLGIQNIIYGLPERERDIIIMYYGFKDNIIYNQSEIAKKMNLSQSRVSRIIKRVNLELKKKILEDNLIDDIKIMVKR